MSTSAASFDARYRADPDPWATHSSAYELTKATDTLAALPDRPIGPALEMGCGAGALTEPLASRCAHVLATDFSHEAVRITAKRTARRRNVTVERRDLRSHWPEDRFDLVVCAEVLYYWTRHEVLTCLDRMERALSPGGALICVHWTGRDPDAPLDGQSVHSLLRGHTTLASVTSEQRDGYVIDRFDRA